MSQVRRMFPVNYRKSATAPDLLLKVEDSLTNPTGQTPVYTIARYKDSSAIVHGGTATVDAGSITSAVDAVSGETFWCWKMSLTGFDVSSLAIGLYSVKARVNGADFPTSFFTLRVID